MFNPLLLSPNSNSYANPIESVPSERYQTKTKAMTSSNQNTGKYLKEPIRTQSKNNLPAEAREKASDQVVIDFSFEWNRLRGWCKFFGPVIDSKNAGGVYEDNFFSYQMG